MNLSNLSALALHIGHTPGGPSRAHKYPQTRHLHTGSGSEDIVAGICSLLFLSSGGFRLSGMGATLISPSITLSDT